MTQKISTEHSGIKKRSKKSRMFRLIRNIVISFVALLILLVVAGVAYTWYMGQNSSVNTSNTINPVKIMAPPSTTPTSLAANAKEGASIQAITSPLAPGSNASITVKTNQYSKCTITVVYNKVPSTDSGLVAKTADEYGIATWSWTVESTAPIGKWPVTVTCIWNKQSAVVVGDLVVAK